MKNKNAVSSRSGLIQRMLLTPYSVWALLFIVVPLFFIAFYAFTDSQMHFTLDNMRKVFTYRINEDQRLPYYVMVFGRSFKLAVISTLICLLLGYPFAYRIAHSSAKVQSILITVIMIPMWMNFLIRTYAWMVILQDKGILNAGLELLGAGPIHVIGTETAVIIGMVYDYLPYMILPIYSVMAKMDNKLLEAAKDLGCNGFGVLRRVIWPLSLPGVISGVNMVLIPSVSTFYISQKLGGKMKLIGDEIEEKYANFDFNGAAAIAFIMMVLLLVVMALLQHRATKRSVA
ncbi:MAG: ABC transporter permease [Oscillospiraceae bacterium]|jgi:spermidine/putrescine transport system permease protein|nr:ABC transporter permease [Oscillospiraceae bacterium]